MASRKTKTEARKQARAEKKLQSELIVDQITTDKMSETKQEEIPVINRPIDDKQTSVPKPITDNPKSASSSQTSANDVNDSNASNQPSANNFIPITNNEPSAISPSLKNDDLKNNINLGQPTPDNPNTKNQAKKAEDKTNKATAAGKEALTDAERKGAKAIARRAAVATGQALSKAGAWLVSSIGWPALAGCLAVFLVVLLIFGGLMCVGMSGYFGKSFPQAAGKDDPNVQSLIAATKKPSSGNNKVNKLTFLNKRDQEYLESGKIDKRLAALLSYIVEKHDHIRISHIVSGYESIGTDPESGAYHDSQITRNISAHREGLAADIDEIDFLKGAPVKIVWQAIGESSVEVPDILNQIKGPNDFLNENIQEALSTLGVKGLDQQDLAEKIKSKQTLSTIKDVFDLTDPKVIAAFNEIGVTGLDNSDLQSGLKRTQAIKSLYELNPQDITALKDPQVQKLFSDMGVPVSDETTANIEKYQAIAKLQTVGSIDDLQSPSVTNAMTTLGLDPNNPDFQNALKKTKAANTVASWEGDLNSTEISKLQDAFAELGIQYKDGKSNSNTSGNQTPVKHETTKEDLQKAWEIYQTAKKVFSTSGLLVEPKVLQVLQNYSVYVDDPKAQDAIKKIRASYQLINFENNYADPAFLDAIKETGIVIGQTQEKDARFALDKYKAAQKVIDYQGDYNDPEFLASLSSVGIDINLSEDEKEGIKVYKAGQVLAQAADGQISVTSQAVKDALATIKTATIDDQKAKSAINVANNTDPNKAKEDKKILGLDKKDIENTINKLQAAKSLSNVKEFTFLQDSSQIDSQRAAVLKQNLQTVGLGDSKYYSALSQIGAAQAVLSIKNPSDLTDATIKKSLDNFGIKYEDKKVVDVLSKMGSFQQILQIKTVADLQAGRNQNALKNLGVKDPKIYKNIGKIGEIQTLTQIKSPWDLTKPQVIDTLGDLGVANASVQVKLGQAGSLYSLTQIQEPADLLQSDNLKALDQLGVIKLDSQLLGQAGAVQTLLQVHDFKDLLNPNSILALNNLGLISLSNPVSAALVAVSFLNNILGGSLFGGLFGGCNSAKCYRDTAQKNIHTVITEMLQFPYDKNNKTYYRPNQIITYSSDRDVVPFTEKLSDLYGIKRPNNFGLFAMPEARDHIHVGY